MSMFLGTAVWNEGPAERRALVARLASGRLADLNRIEAVRLRKLGDADCYNNFYTVAAWTYKRCKCVGN